MLPLRFRCAYVIASLVCAALCGCRGGPSGGVRGEAPPLEPYPAADKPGAADRAAVSPAPTDPREKFWSLAKRGQLLHRRDAAENRAPETPPAIPPFGGEGTEGSLPRSAVQDAPMLPWDHDVNLAPPADPRRRLTTEPVETQQRFLPQTEAPPQLLERISGPMRRMWPVTKWDQPLDAANTPLERTITE